jgi:hypothetical protein
VKDIDHEFVIYFLLSGLLLMLMVIIRDQFSNGGVLLYRNAFTMLEISSHYIAFTLGIGQHRIANDIDLFFKEN